MRKFKLFTLSLTVLSIFMLTGCDDDNNKDADYPKLESRTQFFNLKDELDLVDRQLDTYDNYIEAQYKQGNLSYEDYRKHPYLTPCKIPALLLSFF